MPLLQPLQWEQAAPSGAGPFLGDLPPVLEAEQRVGGVTDPVPWCSEGKVQRSDLAADVLSCLTGERGGHRLCPLGYFQSSHPKMRVDFFRLPVSHNQEC